MYDVFILNYYFTVPPKTTNPPEPRSLLAIGENHTLTCKAFGDPLPKITWTKDGVPVDKIDVTGYHFHLNNVKLEDVGSYRCTASNGYGDDATTISIVGIRLPPKITNPPEPRSLLAIGVNHTLTCKAFGDPLPKTTWTKDGVPVDKFDLTGNDCEIKTVGITLQSEIWNSALSNQQSDSKVYAKNPAKQLYSVGLVYFSRFGSVVATVKMEFGKSVTDPLKPMEDEIKLKMGSLGHSQFAVNLH
ncbi:Tyrosine-protein phosphatase Lar [Stylophora pistillata]|uniref:Tyrosine-protein phosphatase Lar n=1 Tax=Stylophora pistillata TaxID=50429 RepID=A0A2B4RZK0_STYPI|nr:Tyrosine-protein phosphatase Lar [Stylophora pistillata]